MHFSFFIFYYLQTLIFSFLSLFSEASEGARNHRLSLFFGFLTMVSFLSSHVQELLLFSFSLRKLWTGKKETTDGETNSFFLNHSPSVTVFPTSSLPKITTKWERRNLHSEPSFPLATAVKVNHSFGVQKPFILKFPKDSKGKISAEEDIISILHSSSANS